MPGYGHGRGRRGRCRGRRWVDQIPETTHYRPNGQPQEYCNTIILTIEELEALRLVDLEDLTQEEIAGLVVMAISIAYFQMKGEMKKPMEMLKLQGKLEELKDAIEKTKSIENRFVKILNQLGVYVYSVLDIPAYTFLLPVIPFIISFISDPSSSGDKLEMAVNGLLNSSLITLSAATLKKIIDKIASSIKK